MVYDMSLLNLRRVEPKVVFPVTVVYDMSLLNLRRVDPKGVFSATVVYDMSKLNLRWYSQSLWCMT